MADYVLDTHALCWYLVDRARLGPRARTALDAAAQGNVTMAVPAIVAAELLPTKIGV